SLGIDRENGNRPRERGEPAADATLLLFPAEFAADAVAWFVFIALKAGATDKLNELFPPLRRIAVIRRREVGKFLEAAVAKMVESELGAFEIIGDNVADAGEVFEEGVDVDDGDFAFADLIDLQTVAEANDHAIAVPKIGERGALVVVLRVEQEVPVAVIL